jgi:osmoprotectant transport system permease protein
VSGGEAALADLPRTLAGHVQLTLLALAMGLAVSGPLGTFATRRPTWQPFVLGIASVLQTIPGLALLAMMVPLLGFVGGVLEARGLPGPPSIGFLPAVLALALYSVLPMLRNTVVGLMEVDPALVEAARGVGMSPREVLWQVEIPLALPTLVAGVRTATVWVVGTATLATPVGGTSLGNPIFSGLQTRNLSAVLIGSLAAAVLALCLDGLIRLIEDGLARRSKPRLIVALGAIAGIGLLSVAQGMGWDGAADGAGASTQEVRIGSKSFTEQYILAEILAGVVASEPGTRVERISSLGSTVAFDALVAGDLDLYVDYSGTVWATILRRKTLGVDRAEVLGEVTRRLGDRYGVAVVASLGFENTYGLAVRAADADRLGLRRISDLAHLAPGFEILGDFEFFGRPEWEAIQARYGLAFGRERAMDASLMYEALRSGNADVISAYSTDGRISAYDLRVLEDDQGVIPPYDAIILASQRFLTAHPAIAGRLAELEGRLRAEPMRRLNAAVDLDGRSPSEVADGWLRECWAGSGEGRECGP